MRTDALIGEILARVASGETSEQLTRLQREARLRSQTIQTENLRASSGSRSPSPGARAHATGEFFAPAPGGESAPGTL